MVHPLARSHCSIGAGRSAGAARLENPERFFVVEPLSHMLTTKTVQFRDLLLSLLLSTGCSENLEDSEKCLVPSGAVRITSSLPAVARFKRFAIFCHVGLGTSLCARWTTRTPQAALRRHKLMPQYGPSGALKLCITTCNDCISLHLFASWTPGSCARGACAPRNISFLFGGFFETSGFYALLPKLCL